MDPDKIIAGLKACIASDRDRCNKCPYTYIGCGDQLRKDARKYLLSIGECKAAKNLIPARQVYIDTIEIIEASLTKATITPAELENLI